MARTILLCLHGWQGSKDSFTELREVLQGSDIEILTPDLPGFGAEPEPPHPWTVWEYAEWVVHWLRQNGKWPFDYAQGDTSRGKLFVLGHSFGGQIAAYIAAHQLLPATHLFLCAPAIVRSRFGLRRAIGYVLAKAGRTITAIPGLEPLRRVLRPLLYALVRSHDYERSSPLMQKTLAIVTRESLTEILPMIHAPTDIFWGTADRQTHIREAAIVHNGIPGSTLHTFPGIRHRVHRDRAKEIAEVIRRA